MYIEIFLGIFILSYLRKAVKETSFAPYWNKIFFIGMLTAVVLMVAASSIPHTKTAAILISNVLLIFLIYQIFTRPELKAVKPLMYAIAPPIVVQLLSNLIQYFSPGFHDEWENYFDAAMSFSFIWMAAMFLITRKQRKTLEQERLKAVEREKEFQLNEVLKSKLEIQVTERTEDLTRQKEALQQTVLELKSTQDQLVQSEKMASLGELTAGIAHEIQNPLNFVNNFSDLNTELITEMKEALAKGDLEEAKALANDISENEKKINHHGKRADSIVKGMLQHSRSSNGLKEPTDINGLSDEYLRLAYHGLRAKDKSFNAIMKTEFDPKLTASAHGKGKVNVIPQDLGRVILNLITNAFYAVNEKKKILGANYEPTVTVGTHFIPGVAGTSNKLSTAWVEIKVQDNGNGIPLQVRDKIFQPFFTTKPTGQGTGLGLSMSYDIVTKGHGGSLSMDSKEGEGTTFTIRIPA
jgi:signal transduction histidine kinase